ncbi:MAG TPA: DUF484 family protein [Stellaceae bacterium]|nr:DUF484 family protein [Stellaceae bacterium]
MVDRPRDKQVEAGAAPAADSPTQPLPPATTRAEPAVETSARDVIAYLRRHPDFLDRHPEALRLLRAPTREVGERVLDFQHFQIERLRRDMARVNLEHRTLLAASRGNLASQGRVHKAAVAILAASSFEMLLQTVTTDLAVLLDVDAVTIGVESEAAPAGRLRTQGIHLLKAGMVDALLGAERPAIFHADAAGDPVLFGGAAGLVRSQALLRMSFGRGSPMGLLCIGTRQPGRFHPGLGIELLSFLARVLGITISQWLNPPR